MYFAHFDKGTRNGQLLGIHLQTVRDQALIGIPPVMNFSAVSHTDLQRICGEICMFHDLGKYTSWFQSYLMTGKGQGLHEKNHAHISACMFFNFRLQQIPHIGNKWDKVNGQAISFIGYLCIRLHHSSLTMKELFSFPVQTWHILKRQACDLCQRSEEVLVDSGLQKYLTASGFNQVATVDGLESNELFQSLPYQLSGKLQNDEWYFFLIFLFSKLIDSDKLDSGGLQHRTLVSLTPGAITHYIDLKHAGQPRTSLVSRREEARLTMLATINSLTYEQLRNTHFFTITAPTGIGKTLASLQCALRLKERLSELYGYEPRIVTAIPFVNIIEQTQIDYECALGKECQIVVHHRLSDLGVGRGEDVPLEQALAEVEAWEGDVILTTFVQLFQSLLTGNNRALKKVNKLAGSIVILDEIQSIPDNYMGLIGALLRKIARVYGTRFILMTATQPKLLEFGDQLLGEFARHEVNNKNIVNVKPIELFTNNQEVFRNMNRTKFVSYLNENLNSDTFVEFFLTTWHKEQSALIVVNTIKRSIDIYSKLKNVLCKGGIAADIYYLSTNIVPGDRRKVIENVRQHLGANEDNENKRSVILVSTQTIEAGVDLDFDIGFRDLAPLTSLIQTAGRINRGGEKGIARPLYILQFDNDSQHVYKLHHITKTRDILRQREEIMEVEYGELVEQYYQWLLHIGVSQDSLDIWGKGVLGLDFDVINQFALIEDKGDIVDVFVELADADHGSMASQLADAYEELIRSHGSVNMSAHKGVLGEVIPADGNINSPFQRAALLRVLSSKMGTYIMQVRVSRLKNNHPIRFSSRSGLKSEMFWVPPTQVSQFYDKDTGFKDSNGAAFAF